MFLRWPRLTHMHVYKYASNQTDLGSWWQLNASANAPRFDCCLVVALLCRVGQNLTLVRCSALAPHEVRLEIYRGCAASAATSS